MAAYQQAIEPEQPQDLQQVAGVVERTVAADLGAIPQAAVAVAAVAAQVVREVAAYQSVVALATAAESGQVTKLVAVAEVDCPWVAGLGDYILQGIHQGLGKEFLLKQTRNQQRLSIHHERKYSFSAIQDHATHL